MENFVDKKITTVFVILRRKGSFANKQFTTVFVKYL
jgi:hypothetical protein